MESSLAPGGAVGLPPVHRTSPARTLHRRRADGAARILVKLGGWAVIASILAILVVIVAGFFPLFLPPSAERRPSITIEGAALPLAVGLDEYREVAFLAGPDGLRLASLMDGRPLGKVVTGIRARAVIASAPRPGFLALGLADGTVVPIQIAFEASFNDGRRRNQPRADGWEPIGIDRDPPRLLAAVRTGDGATIAAVTSGRELVLARIDERTDLMGTASRSVRVTRSPIPGDPAITAIEVDERGEDAYLGTASGTIIVAALEEEGAAFAAPRAVTAGAAITALALLAGDRTLVVGDGEGRLGSWQVLRDAGKGILSPIERFRGHRAPVASIVPCRRNRGFLTADAGGTLLLHHGTTGKSRLETSGAGAVRCIAFAPRGDGFIAADAGGCLHSWSLHDPYPEVSPGTLFGKVHYEGYREPEHVWQSSGATDDVEPKLGLVPLIFGTLKGTAYALLFSVPVAVLAALYTSQFLDPRWKGTLKPAVEIMAALPSVVLGFVAGLWLAPVLETVVPGIFLLPFTVIPAAILSSFAWRKVPASVAGRIRPGREVFLLIPVVIAAAAAAFALGGIIEAGLLGGDFRGWLRGAAGLTCDQRNSIVVGIAMGFAVIPIIFTITEDSLSNVPPGLVAGSLALGATRWQTALRVVLPTASPGIFSAVMIGFGRAVGETMIVLMATGNTPILDPSIFNGFRALSANIAVELPEAPEGGTLYRVLFLMAFLLFCMTFAVNTAAEVVRLRLRRRYRSA